MPARLLFGFGTINVTVSSPPYCEVYIDGSYIGKTPIKNYTITAGTHKLKIRKDSTWYDYEETFTLSAGGTFTRNLDALLSVIRRIHGHVLLFPNLDPISWAKVEFMGAVVYTDLLGWFDMRDPPMYSGPITASYGFKSETKWITSPITGGLHLVFILV